MSQNQQHSDCKCNNAKQVAELQKKLRELNKYVNDIIPQLKHEIEILRKAIKR